MTDPPTVDFDHHDPEFHRNRHAEWAELRRCPVAFNPNYGGFWVVSGYDPVAAVSRDGATYSSRHVPRATTASTTSASSASPARPTCPPPASPRLRARSTPPCAGP